MTVLMKCYDIGETPEGFESADGRYLKSMDFDANNGWGDAVFTDNTDEAMIFKSPQEALGFWSTQSKIEPLRPDGKPNKPMTAFTVELVLKDGSYS